MEPKKVTIQDIAEKANVSKSTVSRVINNSTPVNERKKKAVLSAMKTMNFQPNVFARGLAGGFSMTLGIVTQNIGSPFFDTVTQGIIHSLVGTSYSPIFVDGQWDRETARSGINTLLGRQVDGLIIVGGNMSKELMDKIKEKTPCIFVGPELENWDNQCVFIDNFDAAYKATKFLIDAGHRDIAHITGIPDQPDSISRLKGYQQALADNNIRYAEELAYEGNFDAPSGVLAIESLLMRGKSFTAIFAANDMTAYGARLGLHRRGIRVPEDVSIIGFDDQAESAFVTPPLTTVRQPAFEMGHAAGSALVKLLKNEPYDLPVLKAELQVRESVAKIRAR